MAHETDDGNSILPKEHDCFWHVYVNTRNEICKKRNGDSTNKKHLKLIEDTYLIQTMKEYFKKD